MELKEMEWWNFTTGQWETNDNMGAESLQHYIPKGAARNLFALYVMHEKMEPLEAMKNVLERMRRK